jgi:hypothetical protein
MFELKDNEWLEITTRVMKSVELPAPEFDYDITIQSTDLTNDGVIDYVVNFRPAPWDEFDVPNQGRDFGTVISNHTGTWGSLPMVEFGENFSASENHKSVESIEFVNGVLFGAWFGSCGRPCGAHIYRWSETDQRFEGTEATKRQSQEFGRPACMDFQYTWSLPLTECQAGSPVSYLQVALGSLGYEISDDGYFGPATRFAVQYYQRLNGIQATGNVDFETWKSLFEGVALPGFDLNGDQVIAPEELSGT